MKSLRLFLLFITICAPLRILAVDYGKVIDEAQKTISGKLYSGFGFSRDIINHSIFDIPLQPRDVDIAILDSPWDTETAKKELSRIGEVQKVKTMKTGIRVSEKTIAEVTQGFFVHVNVEGVVFDFKFFKSLNMAQERGFTNIEKILIPLEGSFNGLIDYLKKNRSKLKSNLKSPLDISIIDQHQGFNGVIERKLKIINWSGIEMVPLKSAIHIGRLVGQGYKYSSQDFGKLKRLLVVNPSLHGVDSYYLDRLYTRQQSSVTYDFLNRLGVTRIIKKQRLFEAGEVLGWIYKQGSKAQIRCHSIFGGN